MTFLIFAVCIIVAFLIGVVIGAYFTWLEHAKREQNKITVERIVIMPKYRKEAAHAYRTIQHYETDPEKQRNALRN